jgi:hypothetical protein
MLDSPSAESKTPILADLWIFSCLGDVSYSPGEVLATAF